MKIHTTLVWLHCLSAPATTGNLWHLCGCWSNSQWSLLYQYLIFPSKFCFEITRMKWLVLDQIQILISAIPKLNSNFGIGLVVGEVVEKKTYFSSEIWLIIDFVLIFHNFFFLLSFFDICRDKSIQNPFPNVLLVAS